ncbi:hypothetical protein L1987_13358 [Smallanthus sonchifolius]|uniref:Uncharacterized protein n=1 Tax=Smallanthus sonchifolius TaxID=185202 RepID=A0ACB9JG87_9ASTR|nr:hypothetical protein L1987_13358 [Smallanthus sonchifolius]
MGEADPPTRRTVHQRASDMVLGVRSSITRPAITNATTWQIPLHVMRTITHATQFHGLEDEDAPGTPIPLRAHFRCPKHGLSDLAIVEKLYNSLIFAKQQIINPTAGGHIMDKLDPSECEEMFESFALAEQQHPSTRTSIPSARAYASFPRGEDTTPAIAPLLIRNRDARQRLDSHDTILKNQHSAFQDLKRTVGDIVKSLKEKQVEASTTYKSSNASVMAVLVLSHGEEEVVEKEASHGAEYGIPSVEEVKKVDWRARFAEIDARGARVECCFDEKS